MPSVAVAFDRNPFAIVFDHKIDPVTDGRYLRAEACMREVVAHCGRDVSFKLRVRFLDLPLVGNFWCCAFGCGEKCSPHITFFELLGWKEWKMCN